MNYFPFHVGDYMAHTAHLEPLEDLAYRRLLDLYYLRESPLPADVAELARLIRLRSSVQEIEAVLGEFFTLTDSGWSHVRCDAEISKMQDKQQKARASAQASVSARSANAQRTLNVRSTDAELPTPTPTPTPTPKTKKSEAKASSCADAPDWVPSAEWADFIAMRKAMRGVPFTAAAQAGVVRELDKLRQAGHDPGEMLTLAVTSGWRTVYAPKGVGARPGGLNKQEALEANNHRIAMDWVAKKRREQGEMYDAE